jgi:hypothetical protein
VLAAPAACYRAAASVLGRRAGAATSPDPAHAGWLRLEGRPGADSGDARLVDEDGAALGARWRRAAGDSMVVVGFDDFLRVELRLVKAGGALTGSGLVTSDAQIERDSAGRARALRRRWAVAARRAACERMPRPWQERRR